MKVINVFSALLLAALLSAPVVFAAQPDVTGRKADKVRMQVEKEQRKIQHEKKKEERTRRREAKKEERKRLKEMKREERKRAGKAKGRAGKIDKNEGLGIMQQSKSEGEKLRVKAVEEKEMDRQNLKKKGLGVAREKIEGIQAQMQLELEEKLRKEIEPKR